MPRPTPAHKKLEKLMAKFPDWDWSGSTMPTTSQEGFSLFCPAHGEFTTTYNRLDRKSGGSPCPKCSHGLAGKKIRIGREQWVARISAVWGDKIRLVGPAEKALDNTEFLCNEHGSFMSTPMRIVNGHGCPECARLARIKGIMKAVGVSAEEFLRRAKDAHECRYEYDLSAYTKVTDKVRVVCPEHGEFYQIGSQHLGGRGCVACGRKSAAEKQAGVARVDEETFIRRANEVHESRYTYDLTGYSGATGTVGIVCPDHGHFEQLGHVHLNGSGCPSCGNKRISEANTSSFSSFVTRARAVHGDRYEYNEPTYTRITDTLEIVCPDHGVFEQTGFVHLVGSGCPKCARERLSAERTGVLRFDAEEFARRASETHGGKYEYHNDTYKGVRYKLKIDCPTHGSFWQTASAHLYNQTGCPKCADGQPSKGENSVADLFEPFTAVVRNSRAIISPLELDIFLPEHSVAVEYCGLYWHGEMFKSSSYHAKKLDSAEDRGIHLLTIFEDEWNDLGKREILKSMLMHKIGQSKRMHARKLKVEQISWPDAKAFYEQSHIAGPGSPARLNFALTDDAGIVQCLSVGSGRYDRGSEELYRMCSRLGVTVVGGFSRLLSAVKPHLRGNLVSYVDLRFGNGRAYEAAGFTLVGRTEPGYFWCSNAGQRLSRHSMQKHKLKDRLKVFDPELSEAENCRANGLWRIHDCGHLKFELVVSQV